MEKSYYSRNLEDRRLYGKKYRLLHIDEIRLKKRQYDALHKEEISIKNKIKRQNNLEKYRERERIRERKKNPEMIRKNRLKRDFGLSLEDYKKIYNEQQGRCAICGNIFKVLCVDHIHSTGKIRGLLCSQCNLALGNAREDIAVLKNAIKYLNLYNHV
jgi:hypothetical protein